MSDERQAQQGHLLPDDPLFVPLAVVSVRQWIGTFRIRSVDPFMRVTN